ncbi:MAG: dTDP-4-dehydrorhamnose 3,5-epimerase [Solirubrobacterales bacterium]|nr:dTDP-4-dehydrorhamnose 3,5-epimerase [Solirubrobacterales bacterium]
MRVIPNELLEGPLLLEPTVHRDGRGFFTETFRASALEQLGVTDAWVQDNHSRSDRGVVRGMHFHIGDGVAKLVRCGRGAIWDVLVDLRRDSPTYGRWEGFDLDDETQRLLYVPRGFAHGFCVGSEIADVLYKQSAYYDPAVERGIAYDDPDVAIAWPIELELTPSPRDASAPRLAEIAGELSF